MNAVERAQSEEERAVVYIDGVPDSSAESTPCRPELQRVPLPQNGAGADSPASSATSTPRRPELERIPLPQSDADAPPRHYMNGGHTRNNGSTPRDKARRGSNPRVRSASNSHRAERLATPHAAGADGVRKQRPSPSHGRLLNFTEEENRDRIRREKRLYTPATPKPEKLNYTLPTRDPALNRLATPKRRAEPPACSSSSTDNIRSISTPTAAAVKSRSQSISISGSMGSVPTPSNGLAVARQTPPLPPGRKAEAAQQEQQYQRPTQQVDYARLAQPRRRPEPAPQLNRSVGAQPSQLPDYTRLAKPRHRVERQSELLQAYSTPSQSVYGGTTPITYEPTPIRSQVANGQSRRHPPPPAWGDLLQRSRSLPQKRPQRSISNGGAVLQIAHSCHTDPVVPQKNGASASTRVAVESTAAPKKEAPAAQKEMVQAKPPLAVRATRFVPKEETPMWPPEDDVDIPPPTVFASKRSASVPAVLQARQSEEATPNSAAPVIVAARRTKKPPTDAETNGTSEGKKTTTPRRAKKASAAETVSV